MHEITDELKAIGIFVGTGRCNANCAHCAGIIHRKYAPNLDGNDDKERIREAILEGHNKGARSLSLTSSGEPTLSPLSVTNVLQIIDEIGKEGRLFDRVNLYSNGILLADESFCEQHLPTWRRLGLKNLYVTVHDTDEKRNAEVYGVREYPPLSRIVKNIHQFGLRMRANLVLGRKTIGSLEKFISVVSALDSLGVDSISAWQIRDETDQIDYSTSVSEIEFQRIDDWNKNEGKRYGIKLMNESERGSYELGRKRTLFPDGSFSDKWCK